MNNSHISGRNYFKKYAKLIYFFISLFKVFPFLIIFLNSCFKQSNSKVGLLIRYLFAKVFFLKVGDNVYFASSVVIKNYHKLSVGCNLSLHEFCYIDAAGGIEIGENVSIAHNCSLVSFEHTWNDRTIPIKYNPTILNPIRIGDDVWLGCGVRVLSGTIIENRVIVAAGAVVKGTLESGYLYGGIPARKLKKL